jgi:dihydroflavonol-4-reductase
MRNYERINVVSTQNIIEACTEAGIKRLVHISTANTIGYGTLDNPGTEILPPGEPFLSSLYVRSKLLSEKLVLEAVSSKQIEAIVLCPTFILGPYDAKPGSSGVLMMQLKNRLVLIPPGGKNFVSATDSAIASVNALTMGRPGQKYLLAGTNLSFSELIGLVNSVEGLERKTLKIPCFLLKGIGMIGSIISAAGFRFDLHSANARILCTSNFYSSDKATSDLGMPHTDIRETIRISLNWFRQNGYMK